MKRTVSLQSLAVNRKRGSALVMAVIFTALMTIAAAFAYKSTMFQTRMAARSQDYLVALAIAEAGAELAMVELNEPSATAFTGWTGSSTKSLTDDLRDNANDKVGDFRVAVSDTGIITSTGYVPSIDNPRLKRTVKIVTESNSVPSPFGSFGVFGYDGVAFTGSGDTVSNVGSLGDIELKGSGDIDGNVQAGGSISTKGSGDISGDVEYVDDLEQKGSGKIKGDAIKGSKPTPPPELDFPEYETDAPGGNVNSQIKYNGQSANISTNGRAKYSGSKDLVLDGAGDYDLESLQMSGSGDVYIRGNGKVTIYCENEFKLSGSGALFVDEDVELTIIAEDIKFTGSGDINIYGDKPTNLFAETFDMTGSQNLSVFGDSVVTVYAQYIAGTGSGDLNAAGNKDPRQLQIFASDESDFTGSGDVYGGLYAPKSSFDMTGSGDWYGAVIAKFVERTGSGGIFENDGLLEPSGGEGVLVNAWSETKAVAHH